MYIYICVNFDVCLNTRNMYVCLYLYIYMYLSILFIYIIYIYSVSFIYYPKLVDKDMLLGTTVTFANLR